MIPTTLINLHQFFIYLLLGLDRKNNAIETIIIFTANAESRPFKLSIILKIDTIVIATPANTVIVALRRNSEINIITAAIKKIAEI